MATKAPTRPLCPKCESSRIYHRKNMTPPYRCMTCGNLFDTPVYNSK